MKFYKRNIFSTKVILINTFRLWAKQWFLDLWQQRFGRAVATGLYVSVGIIKPNLFSDKNVVVFSIIRGELFRNFGERSSTGF